MKNYIYIFIHVAKCGGYTFRYHIRKNIKEDRRILLSYNALGLNPINPPSNPEIFQKAAKKYLSSLGREKRRRIKIVFGHAVPYGIHEFFDREPRYFTFLRNPVKRTVSVYNHLVKLYRYEGNDKEKLPYYQKTLLLDSNIPMFPEWLEHKYDLKDLSGHLTMTGYLRNFGYFDNNIINTGNISKMLDKFYFVGLTKNLNEESLFLYDKLGIKKYFIDQNISVPSFRLGNNKRIERRIITKNKLDNILFKKALVVNRRFKKNEADYCEIVKRKEIQRMVTLPFTQLLFAPRQSAVRLFKKLVRNEPLMSE